MRTAAILLLLFFLVPGCRQQVPPVSGVNVKEITYGRAAIFGPDTGEVLENSGNYAPGLMDSVKLNSNTARAVVKTLLAARNYHLPPPGKPISYDVMCHIPYFLLMAYDTAGRQTNYFTICFTCGNVRMAKAGQEYTNSLKRKQPPLPS